MNSMNISMDGIPEISGTTWYSKTSNDHFTIKDVMMDGVDFIFTTTDGRSITGRQMENYIQSDRPVNNIPKHAPVKVGNLNKQPKENVVVDPEFDILPEDWELITESCNKTTTSTTANLGAPVNNNYAIIEKAFSKVCDPTLNIEFGWDPKPAKEIEMLVSIMDIPQEDIANFIYEKWFKKNTKIILNEIQNYLDECCQ